MVPALQRLRVLAQGGVGALHTLRRQRASLGGPRPAGWGPERETLQGGLRKPGGVPFRRHGSLVGTRGPAARDEAAVCGRPAAKAAAKASC
jgi:hypothetical protein